VAIVHQDGASLAIGRAARLRDGEDVTLIANGIMVAAALEAASTLEKEGIRARVIDMHTVKPLDVAAVAEAARETGHIVVAEEHLHTGALGAAVAQAVVQSHPVPMAFVDLGDQYAESGAPEELLEKYGLTGDHIADAARGLLR
jgi:transketolase